ASPSRHTPNTDGGRPGDDPASLRAPGTGACRRPRPGGIERSHEDPSERGSMMDHSPHATRFSVRRIESGTARRVARGATPVRMRAMFAQRRTQALLVLLGLTVFGCAARDVQVARPVRSDTHLAQRTLDELRRTATDPEPEPAPDPNEPKGTSIPIEG